MPKAPAKISITIRTGLVRSFVISTIYHGPPEGSQLRNGGLKRTRPTGCHENRRYALSAAASSTARSDRDRAPATAAASALPPGVAPACAVPAYGRPAV